MLADSSASSSIAHTEKNQSNIYKNKITFVILSIVAALTLIYGLLAIDMGRVNALPIFDDTVFAERLNTAEQANNNPEFRAGLEEARHSGIWLALMANLTSEEYTYDDRGGVFSAIQYYAKKSIPQQLALLIHNTLGGICIIIGALQFIPGLRQKAPKLHKRIGKTYVVVVYGAMIFAGIYLVATPVDDIFAGLSFAFGLWMILALVVFSLSMALYHAIKKQIAQHQAYMALNFSLLLSAPLLRYDWTLMGVFLPIEKDFLEGNFAVLIFLLPHCIISGYFILTLNRWVQKDRTQANTIELSKRMGQWILKTKPFWLAFSTVAMISLAYNYLYLLEVGQKSAGISSLPQSFIDHETQMLKPLLSGRILLVGTSILAFGLGAINLQRLFSDNNSQVNKPLNNKNLSSLAAISLCGFGLVLCYLGYEIGLPGWVAVGGGAFYMTIGALSVLFGLLQLANTSLGNWVYVRELALLGYSTALAIPLFDLIIPLMPLFNITEQHIVDGHGYMITAMTAPFAFVFAFGYVIYGELTASKFAR